MSSPININNYETFEIDSAGSNFQMPDVGIGLECPHYNVSFDVYDPGQ